MHMISSLYDFTRQRYAHRRGTDCDPVVGAMQSWPVRRRLPGDRRRDEDPSRVPFQPAKNSSNRGARASGAMLFSLIPTRP
jgi:hypothetical protein